MNYFPNKKRCAGCRNNGNSSCRSLPFDKMPKLHVDGSTTVVQCTAYDDGSTPRSTGRIAIRNASCSTERPVIKWTPEMEALLGTAPDCEIADKLACSESTVARQRHSLGINSFASVHHTRRHLKPRSDKQQIPAEVVPLLGTTSDRMLAKKFGISPSVVRFRRSELGIPAYDRWSKHRANKPATSNRPWVHPNTIKWTPEALSLLGKVSDNEVALSLGISRASVLRKRQTLGVPPKTCMAHIRQEE